MVASTYKSNEICGKELEDKLMKFTTTCVDEIGERLVEQTEQAHGNAGIEVDKIGRINSDDKELVEAHCQQMTESSSSFDDSDFEVENTNTLGDSEALSNFRGDAESTMDFDAFDETFRMRKKKVTTHWRSFIQPLMWRCKWAELQIRELQSQAKKYDKIIEEYSHQKKVQYLKPEGLCAKSLPFTGKNARNEALKRKKRRKNETAMNLAEYVSRHNIFSYYEYKKAIANDASKDDMFKNPANTTQTVNNDDEFLVNDGPLCLKTADGDNSLEHVLRKIGTLESQIGNLKSRVAKVNSENAGKFSSTDNSRLLISPENTSSPPNNGGNISLGTDIVSQLISGLSRDIFLPESLVTTREEVLIDNQKVKNEMNNFDEMRIPEHPDTSTEDQPPLEITAVSKFVVYARKNKRKRGTGKDVARQSQRSTS